MNSAPGATSGPVAGCPKRMVFGPCGGVRPGGGCEMVASPCVFTETARWPGVPAAAPAVQTPLVLTDLSVPPADAAALRRIARLLAPSCDALLVGDHQDRPDFAPSLLARLLREVGASPWVTLSCRDRNRLVLEQELRTLHHDGGATVLCVTGDGRAFDIRPEVTQVFDLDGTRLAALAASIGLPVAVAETVLAPPAALRPDRLVTKQRAGAGIGVLNHVESPADVASFLVAARRAGLAIPVIASVVVYTDPRSAAVLNALPGLDLDPVGVEAVLSASNPVQAGIDRAITQAASLLALDGVCGVNLSGLASSRGPHFAAEIQAEIGLGIRELVVR